MPDQNVDNTPRDDDPLAELADLILNVGRLVRARTPAGADGVLMTETERQVMRVVDLYPGSSPSEIAARAHLQRTNVSAALRSLEGNGMITRKPTAGRGVEVLPTRKAAANLRRLRAAWSRELTGALGENLTAVRQCNDLLSGLERHFIET